MKRTPRSRVNWLGIHTVGHTRGLKKLFNIREGWQRADDTLPPRALTETLPTGIVQGVGLTQADLDLMIQGYYTARGWTAKGLIPVQKLRELELLEIV